MVHRNLTGYQYKNLTSYFMKELIQNFNFNIKTFFNCLYEELLKTFSRMILCKNYGFIMLPVMSVHDEETIYYKIENEPIFSKRKEAYTA